MDLAFSHEQLLFADVVERLLSDRYSFEHRRRIVASATGEDESIRAALADVGALGLPVSPAAGGYSGSMVDVALLMKALGRHLVVEPVLPNAVMSGRLLESVGATDLIAELVTGATTMAFADGRGTVTVGLNGLSGEIALVDGAALADLLLVAVDDSDGATGLFAVPLPSAGLSLYPVRLLDGRRAGDLHFVHVSARRLAVDVGQKIQSVVGDAVIASIWEAVGSMEAAFAQTSAYVRERKQFDRRLADFQVVQHRVAEMAVACREAHASALLAVFGSGSGEDAGAIRAISGGKVRVARCARIVAEGAVQLHGGMGVSEELSIAAHFRKLLAFESSYGTVAHHLDQYAGHVVEGGHHRHSVVLAVAA